MDLTQIIELQRNLILKKYGIDIEVEKNQQLDGYKYIIKNGEFQVTIFRKDLDEIDTLKQITIYLDTTTHQLAYTEAAAYDYCYRKGSQFLYGCFPASNSKYYLGNISEKLNQANTVELSKNIEDVGLSNISLFNCTNVIGLEKSKDSIINLHANLSWLKSTIKDGSINFDELESPEKE